MILLLWGRGGAAPQPAKQEGTGGPPPRRRRFYFDVDQYGRVLRATTMRVPRGSVRISVEAGAGQIEVARQRALSRASATIAPRRALTRHDLESVVVVALIEIGELL